MTKGLGPVTEALKEEAKMLLTEANENKLSAEKVNQALAEKCTGMREEEDFRVTEVSHQRPRKSPPSDRNLGLKVTFGDAERKVKLHDSEDASRRRQRQHSVEG